MFLMLVLLQVDFHLFYPPDFALAHAHLSSAPASSIRVILIRCAPCTRVWQAIHNYPPLRSAPPLSALATILNSPTFPPSRHPHPPSSFTLTAAKSYAVKTVPKLLSSSSSPHQSFWQEPKSWMDTIFFAGPRCSSKYSAHDQSFIQSQISNIPCQISSSSKNKG